MNGDAADSSNDDNDDIPAIQPVFTDDLLMMMMMYKFTINVIFFRV